MKLGDLEGGRWLEHAIDALGAGAAVLWAYVGNDYQDNVSLLVRLEDGRFAFLEYSFGSCSGCDPYEDMEPAAIVAEFKRDAAYFPTELELTNWGAMLRAQKARPEVVEAIAKLGGRA